MTEGGGGGHGRRQAYNLLSTRSTALEEALRDIALVDLQPRRKRCRLQSSPRPQRLDAASGVSKQPDGDGVISHVDGIAGDVAGDIAGDIDGPSRWMSPRGWMMWVADGYEAVDGDGGCLIRTQRTEVPYIPSRQVPPRPTPSRSSNYTTGMSSQSS